MYRRYFMVTRFENKSVVVKKTQRDVYCAVLKWFCDEMNWFARENPNDVHGTVRECRQPREPNDSEKWNTAANKARITGAVKPSRVHRCWLFRESSRNYRHAGTDSREVYLAIFERPLRYACPLNATGASPVHGQARHTCANALSFAIGVELPVRNGQLKLVDTRWLILYYHRGAI